MQQWDAKKSTENLTRTYFLPKIMRDAGITISACTVSQAQYNKSTADTGTIDVLSGSKTISVAPITYKGVIYPIGTAVLQNVYKGVASAEYVITFTMTLSTGETFVEDCLQPVTTYVPTP